MSHLMSYSVRFFALALCLTAGLLAAPHQLVAQEAAESVSAQISYEKLADAAIATALKLTDEQKTQIAELLKARAEALAQAAEADKPKAIAESDQKLAALLTQEQRTALAEYKPEPQLRFNFRFQKWTDVLEWFAEQSDLSLVLDAPPPGTFNYTDRKTYTPSEAIDLLNGFLQTKGYTLIRRKRMLLVINLKDGIPDELVPRVTLDELEQRGRFEMVRVMFPLEGRPAEEVKTEISPLLGRHGKAIALPKTKQILVTDMAGIMRSVSAIISSIPIPQPPAKKPDPPPPEKPILTLYPIKSADPNAAIEMLKTLVEPAKVIHDPKSEQLNIYATPSQHAVVKTVLEQLQANNPPEKQPRLEVYPIESTDTGQLLENLRLVVPGAQLRVDGKTGNLVAWAAPNEHKTLTATIEKLGQEGSPNQTKQIEVYRLTKADPNTTLTLLQSVLPNARISVDAQSRSLIAVAVPADHRAIQATLDQLQPKEPGPDTPELRFYPFKLPPPSSLNTILAKVAPQAQITSDDAGKRFNILATPADHALITATIEKFQQAGGIAAPPERNKLEIYTVTPAQRTRFQAVIGTLTSELPGIRVITDAEPGELAIWAKPKQHTLIADLINKMKRDVPDEEKYQLIAYSLKESEPGSVQTILRDLYPATRIVPDSNTKRLLIWTTPAEHAKIKSSIEKIVSDAVPDTKPRFVVYPLEGAAGSEMIGSLQPLVPGARLSIDPKTGNLIAWGTPAEHKLLQQAVGKLGEGATPQQTPQVEVHRLTKAEPGATLSLLQGLLPQARLSIDNQTRSLIAIAVPADQQAIRSMLEQLQPEQPAADAPELRFYPFEKSPPASLTSVLASLAPKAQASYDSNGKRLMVVASPADHEIVKTTVERVQSATLDEEKNVLEVYPVTTAQRKRFQAILDTVTSELPGIRVITDAEPGELSIWAKPSQHALLAEILGKLKRDVSPDEKFELVAYAIKATDPANAQTVLQELFPGTRIVLDAKTRRLLIWTRPEEHLLIRHAVEQINSGVSSDMQETFRVYPLSDVDANIAISMLQLLLPDVRLSSDPVAKTMLVWGRKADHATIEKTLKQMQDASQSKTERQVVFYPIGKGEPGALAQALRGMAPGARIDIHARAGKLLAWGTAAEQETIRATIEKLSGEDVAGAAAEVVIHTIQSVPVSTAIQVLQSVVPQARYSYGSDPQRLIVWARRDDQATIQEVIDKIETDAKPGDKRVLAVYPLHGANGSTLSQVLAPFQAQGAQIVSDTTRDSLIIRASEVQQAAIKQAIEDLTAKLPKEKKPTSKVYRFQIADPYAAQTVLSSLTPNARYAIDSRNRSLVVSALEEDHEKIQKVVDEMDQESAAADAQQMKSYRVNSINPSSLLGMLQTLFAQYPEVRFAADPQSGTIAALANLAQHKRIQQIIDEVGKTEEGATSHVYRFQRADPYAAISVLQSLTPNARMVVDSNNRSLVVSASAAEHKKIAETIAQMDSVDKDGQTPLLRSYPMVAGDAQVAVSVLQTLFANTRVRISLDSRNDMIVALASPTQHELIKTSIDEMEKKGQGRTSHVYRFKNADPYAASTVLGTLTPRAQVAVDARSRTLVVSATAADHAKIKSTIEQMEGEEGEQSQATELRSYPMNAADSHVAIGVLQTLFATRPEVRLSLDSRNDTIVALATPVQHEMIKKSIDAMEKQGAGRTSHVYRFKNADPYAASTVFGTLTPRAQLAVDARNRTLVVSATPADHAKIKATIEQMEGEDSDGQAPRLKAYPLKASDPAALISMLQTLFATHPEVRFSVDTKNESIVAIASESQHETIGTLIAEVDKKSTGDDAAKIEVYAVDNSDAESMLTMLRRLFAKQTQKVDLSVDPGSNQIVAIARPQQHAMIRATLEQLKTEEPDLEVFQLEVVDPLSAELAIDRLFGHLGFNNPNSPIVDSDLEMQQLYVRATPDQLAEIRKLLVKMGETNVVGAQTGSDQKLRVIPFRGDARAAVTEIQRVWPQLRKNSIRVVVPSAVAPLLRRAGEDRRPNEKEQNKKEEQNEKEQSSSIQEKLAPSKAQFSVPPDQAALNQNPKQAPTAAAETEETSTIAVPKQEKPTDSDQPATEPPAQEEPAAQDESQREPEPKPAPEILIAPGTGSITIASDDLEALNQLESLLRTMSRRTTGSRGHEYIVFSLRNASAEQIAVTLQQLFRNGSLGSRSSGRVTVVPDLRLNALVVHGNRADRETIEELLNVLDSDNVPDSLLSNRPKLIPIKNTDAMRIEEILRDIYKSQVTRGGGRRPIPVPSGVSQEVAAAIEQLNASSSGPLLTLGVDEITNSLIVMAPSSLVEEIEKLVGELDESAAEGTSRGLTIIPLKQVNTESVQDALEMIFDDRVRIRTRSGRNRNGRRRRSR